MGWHGCWASPGDWQTHHSRHPGHQRNSFSVSTPVHSSAAGECDLLPQHNEHRIRSRCSRCFCLVFTPAALCWWAKNIIIIIIIIFDTGPDNKIVVSTNAPVHSISHRITTHRCIHVIVTGTVIIGNCVFVSQVYGNKSHMLFDLFWLIYLFGKVDTI